MAVSDRKPGAMNLFESARGRWRVGVRRAWHRGAWSVLHLHLSTPPGSRCSLE